MLNPTSYSTTQVHGSEDNAKFPLSAPKLLLHFEGVILLVASIVLYASQGFAWSTFLLLLLAPDLAFVAYIANRNLGTFFYNALHTVALPLILAVAAFMIDWTFGIQLALIWLAHVGMDRTVGYGLKYTNSFKNTHLSKI